MVEQVPILVGNASTLVGLGYTRIEVWQSTDQGNSYQELTSPSAANASLTSARAATTFRMGGKQLRLSVNGGAEQAISFDSLIQYWTPSQVVTRINQVVSNLASLSSDTLSVVLTSPTAGRASSILISSDAPDLGWDAGTLAYGTDARLLLLPNQVSYLYQDVAGADSAYYKWRLSANGVNPISNFSSPVQGVPPPMAGINIALGLAQFVDGSGRPMKRTVIVAVIDTPQLIGSILVGSNATQVYTADDAGFLQIPFVQGTKVRIGIEGSTFVREITVPLLSTFDLMTALEAAPDNFSVQVPDQLLTRRTL